jgi:broad specificity phosphatase PhoE
MKSRRVHLVRHGLTEWNREQRFQGHIDVPLSTEGRQQAQAVAERLAGLPVCHCLASDLSRAFDTARTIALHLDLEIEPDPDLREANKGALEGKFWDARTGRLGDESGFHDDYDLHARPPGGESLIDVRERTDRFFRRLRERDSTFPDGDLLIVAHGGSMRLLLAGMLDLPVEASRVFRFDNCSLTTVHFREGVPPLLVAYNDCRHLEVLSTP